MRVFAWPCVAQEDARFEQVTDVRAQLKFFEQLDQLEKQRKEEQEREILMKAAKVTHTHTPVYIRATDVLLLKHAFHEHTHTLSL